MEYPFKEFADQSVINAANRWAKNRELSSKDLGIDPGSVVAGLNLPRLGYSVASLPATLNRSA
jgi:hypothetical protein